MTQIFFLCLLLVYYWYFYMDNSQPVVKPSTGSPLKLNPFNFRFISQRPNHFQFIVDGMKIWEHDLPLGAFTFHQDKIIKTDPCYGLRDGSVVPAKGQYLYEYLNTHSDQKHVMDFKKDSEFTLQKGDTFYFKCLKGRIQRIDICPSGTTLVSTLCQPITACTNRPDGYLLASRFATEYISCLGGREIVKNCPQNHIFNHNRCEPMNDLTHYCKHVGTPFLLDQETRVECQNEKPIFTRCTIGMMFIDKDYCEPSLCYGEPDEKKFPLPERVIEAFSFIPGYMRCLNNKVHESVDCPQIWDDTLSKGDNLTFLPMVFEYTKQKCSIPCICENVFTNDPDIIVPLYEFQKKIKNWPLSKVLDQSAGYKCQAGQKRKIILPPNMHISKKFKTEPACGPTMPNLLPLYQNIEQYYNCSTQSLETCAPSTFFNGVTCLPKPTHAFTYNNLPLFQFENLNLESWIKPFEYLKSSPPLASTACNNFPESTLIELYNICSHPDCEKYAFLSQIPIMGAILLPTDQKAKCQYYPNEKKLKKEDVSFKYHYWNQKVLMDEETNEKTCQIGQNLETGNFIWDVSLFATCNVNQPFVFCPSAHTDGIIPGPLGYFYCKPPIRNDYILDRVDQFTHFQPNELKRILPIHWDPNAPPIHIRKNRADSKHILPEFGLDILKNTKVNLWIDHPVRLELGFRNTHPPNIALEYIDGQPVDIRFSDEQHGFLIMKNQFTTKSIELPTYTPVPFVENLEPALYS